MKLANVLRGEIVKIGNINTGDPFETYTLEGEPNRGIFFLNGAAARLVQPDDKTFIVA